MLGASRPGQRGTKSDPSTASLQNRLILFWLFYALLLAASPPLPAQTSSSIQGTITDPQSLPIAGATIALSDAEVASSVTVTSDSTGAYRIAVLRAGTYRLCVSKPGFASKVCANLAVTVNESVIFNVRPPVGRLRQVITVSGRPPLLDPSSSASGATIMPQEITEMPINGRNYLDLMQLVPGVAANPQKDPGTDAAVPILGERGGNTGFLIDGMPNSNGVDGGSSSPFDQDSVLEFQVLTRGYKAEFGHSSGGIVNVVTESGTNRWHGLLSAFHRNSVLDSSDISGQTTPFLLRWDTDANLGGPVVKNLVFVFGSVERIRETRQLNFVFPPGTPDFLEQREETFDQPSRTFEARGFLKFDEPLARRHLTEEISLVNSAVTNILPLSEAINLPSTRADSASRYLMLGFHDTATFGNRGTSWLIDDPLFATASDVNQYGPVNSGVYVLTKVGGLARADDLIRLRNNYNGLFVQDDWKLRKSLTANLGMRWDYDSRFPNRTNFSPRLGLAWSATPKTIVDGSWGTFYDHYRLGLARDVPGVGGADLFTDETLALPRLFYGDSTSLPQLEGLCPSPDLTDAEIAASGAARPTPGSPLFGVDHLNSVVAPGHAPIPPNSVVDLRNEQALTGLTPEQFADAANRAVGQQPGYFFWGGFGNLTVNLLVPQLFSVPVAVAPGFKTPYTSAFPVGVHRELTRNTIVEVGYFHRDIRNILASRITNLAFAARLPGHTGELQPGTGNRPILCYGPWFQGRYDRITFGLRKRMSRRFTTDIFYTWANAVDNDLNSSLISEVQTGLGAASLGVYGPTDSFVGVPPVVTDPVAGKANAKGPFIAGNGNPVAQAGKFYNGPNLDRGPSDLALDDTLSVDETARLPWKFTISGVFRAQSGFHFSEALSKPLDVDGDGIFNGVDFLAGRNHFQALPFINLNVRFSRSFAIKDRVHIRPLVEFFNLLNRPNPAAVEQFPSMPVPLGKALQVLPGREGQVGLRIEF